MIIRTINISLAKQLIFASFVATVAFSAPVIMVSLFGNLPKEAIFTGLAWTALASISPMIVYHAMPLFVATAIVWCYANFTTDGTLAAMHLAGLSHLSVRSPAFGVATGAMALGYVVSCWVAPLTAWHLHDVLYDLRHNVNPALLSVGQFNRIDGGRYVIFFGQWLNSDEIADVFIREHNDVDEEHAYVARHGIFTHDGEEGKRGLALLDGSMQVYKSDKAELRTVDFNQLFLPLTDLGGSALNRRSTIADELGPLEFLREREDLFKDPVETRSWLREAVKRFAIPALTFIHTLLGLELLAARGEMGSRQQRSIGPICAIIASLHLAVVVLAEQASVMLPCVWVAIAVIGAELAMAVALAIMSTKGWVLTPALHNLARHWIASRSLSSGRPLRAGPIGSQ
jgi:lipopolysaccharide export LptBFGC system permease protein LptF